MGTNDAQSPIDLTGLPLPEFGEGEVRTNSAAGFDPTPWDPEEWYLQWITEAARCKSIMWGDPKLYNTPWSSYAHLKNFLSSSAYGLKLGDFDFAGSDSTIAGNTVRLANAGTSGFLNWGPYVKTLNNHQGYAPSWTFWVDAHAVTHTKPLVTIDVVDKIGTYKIISWRMNRSVIDRLTVERSGTWQKCVVPSRPFGPMNFRLRKNHRPMNWAETRTFTHGECPVAFQKSEMYRVIMKTPQ